MRIVYFVLFSLAMTCCTFDPHLDADASTDAAPYFPSCASLAATCGADGTDDCCSTAGQIPGGTFYRSYDVGSDGMYPDMSYPATVSPFLLDKYEVTVGRFRQFVKAEQGTQKNPPTLGIGARILNGSSDQGGWDPNFNTNLAIDTPTLTAALACDEQHQTWTDVPGLNENLPINCVTWYEAFAFCTWDYGFLPSEAEWNFVAAGGAEQRAYPWSSPAGSTAIDCSYANYNINYPDGPPFCNGSSATNRVGSESSKGDSKWGQSDLGGNVTEWVLDGFGSYSDPCNDCADLTDSNSRVVRGGDWSNSQTTLRGSSRNYTSPIGNRDPKIGIRCARLAI